MNHAFVKTATPIDTARATLKSGSQVICSVRRPCKRMRCPRCISIRRWFFLRSASRYSEAAGLNHHVVISWPLEDKESPWLKLVAGRRNILSPLSGHRGKYVQVFALGLKCRTPHVHLVVGEKLSRRLVRVVRSSILFCPRVKVDDIWDSEGLFGYLFDQNFLPSFNDSERPRYIRLISSSRGMKCGFPTYRERLELFGEGGLS